MLAITKENFQAEVEQAQGTVLVDFWAQWCGPCRMQAPILEAFAGEHSDIKVAKCDVDENPELAEKFSIMSIPSLLVFKGGKLVEDSKEIYEIGKYWESLDTKNRWGGSWRGLIESGQSTFDDYPHFERYIP